MDDHDYGLGALPVAGDDGDSEVVDIDIDEQISKAEKINLAHTPIKSPHPKKQKKSNKDPHDCIGDTILLAVNSLTTKMDTQTELLLKFERRIEENTAAIIENKENIEGLQKTVCELQEENKRLKESVAEQARYKRRWNLLLNGVVEKDGEDVREIVLGILTRVVPISVERLRETVDSVHRLGKKGDPATSNNTPRSIIIQFVTRTIRNDVWKRSKDARVCQEKHIQFKEDFSKEDREARRKLWPLVRDARLRGERAFLKEGYALINNRRVDPT